MNSSEMFKREKKAARLAAVLFKCRATVDDVTYATADMWLKCAAAATQYFRDQLKPGEVVHPPHSAETVQAVVAQLMRLYEAERDMEAEVEPKSAQQEADEAESRRIRCQRCQCEINEGMLCEECRAEEKWEENEVQVTGADRCPPKE